MELVCVSHLLLGLIHSSNSQIFPYNGECGVTKQSMLAKLKEKQSPAAGVRCGGIISMNQYQLFVYEDSV